MRGIEYHFSDLTGVQNKLCKKPPIPRLWLLQGEQINLTLHHMQSSEALGHVRMLYRWQQDLTKLYRVDIG